jgi:hypothetical protein
MPVDSSLFRFDRELPAILLRSRARLGSRRAETFGVSPFYEPCGQPSRRLSHQLSQERLVDSSTSASRAPLLCRKMALRYLKACKRNGDGVPNGSTTAAWCKARQLNTKKELVWRGWDASQMSKLHSSIGALNAPLRHQEWGGAAHGRSEGTRSHPVTLLPGCRRASLVRLHRFSRINTKTWVRISPESFSLVHVTDQHKRKTVDLRFPYIGLCRQGFPYIFGIVRGEVSAAAAGMSQNKCFPTVQCQPLK